MTQMVSSRSNFRLIEDPLGPAALERPGREEWLALWERAKRQPVPDYPGVTLRRLLPRPGHA